MENPYGPLSGDVMQYWTNFLRSMSQCGLINIINQSRTDNPDLEQKIVSEEYSYGSQLGRINDALRSLIEFMHAKYNADPAWKGNDDKTITDFIQMVRAIDVKKGLLS